MTVTADFITSLISKPFLTALKNVHANSSVFSAELRSLEKLHLGCPKNALLFQLDELLFKRLRDVKIVLLTGVSPVRPTSSSILNPAAQEPVAGSYQSFL